MIADFFYHEGRYWRAVIPLDSIDQVFGQSFNFSKLRLCKGKNGPEICFNKHGMSETYYLYRLFGTNNCTSSPLQILDKVMRYRWHHRFGAMLYRLPINPRFYLRVRGLDSDPSIRKLLRAEFDEYIQDPDTQARKRQWVRQVAQARRAARQTHATRS